MFDLNALQDDWNLNAPADTRREVYLVPVYDRQYLTDPSGNRLTDPDGNYLVGIFLTNLAFPMIVNAAQEDLNLNAPEFSMELNAPYFDDTMVG